MGDHHCSVLVYGPDMSKVWQVAGNLAIRESAYHLFFFVCPCMHLDPLAPDRYSAFQ